MLLIIMSKAKVAIPVFGSHVSPRFDCAREILFIEFENGEIVSQRTTAMEGMNSLQRLRIISASGSTLLACGAMSGFYRRMIDSLGIQIIHAEGVEIDSLIERIKYGEFTLTTPCGHKGRGKIRRTGCHQADSPVSGSFPNYGIRKDVE
jgi:predicted Fe-Mo cluster-binding NifX family protein